MHSHRFLPESLFCWTCLQTLENVLFQLRGDPLPCVVLVEAGVRVNCKPREPGVPLAPAASPLRKLPSGACLPGGLGAWE